MESTVLVLQVKGLTEDEIQKKIGEFFENMVNNYPNKFGVGLSGMVKGTESEKEVLRLADL